MRLVNTGAYFPLLAPGKTDYYAVCHQKNLTSYILVVVPITPHTYERRKPIGKKNKENERKVVEGKERKDNEAKKRKRKAKKRKDKKSKK